MPKTILIVDDEPDLLKLLSARLSAHGYNIITAQDGKEGLEKAKDSKPDLVLLDVLMPRMSGYEVCRMLKFDDRYKSIPVIMLTAKTQEVDREMGVKVNCDGYVTKPFNDEELVDKIKDLLKE